MARTSMWLEGSMENGTTDLAFGITAAAAWGDGGGAWGSNAARANCKRRPTAVRDAMLRTAMSEQTDKRLTLFMAF
jgi:hypothetical protein